jgi:uridine kinase
MNTKTPFKLIALVGGSGAGKSWLSDRLRQELGDEATALSLDDFYRDRSQLKQSERARINFDHPEAIDWPLFESVLRDLRDGVTVLAARYSFVSHTRLTEWEQISPRPFIFVEGLWLLWPPQVRQLFDLRVFLDCAESLRWERRLARDLVERGRSEDSIREQFWNVVAPMHERFVEVQKAWADLVIEQPIAQTELDRLVVTIRALRVEPSSTQSEITQSRTTTPQIAARQSL